jgi:hypothetical protein
MNPQRVESRRMRNPATAGEVIFGSNGRMRKVPIFCDHGHKPVPSSRWTFVDRWTLDVDRGEAEIPARKAARAGDGRKQNERKRERTNERTATQWQSTHPGVKIQPEAKGDTVPEEGEGNWGAETRRGRDRREEEKRANFRIKISGDSSADLVVDKAGPSQSIADIASMLRKSLS